VKPSNNMDFATTTNMLFLQAGFSAGVGFSAGTAAAFGIAYFVARVASGIAVEIYIAKHGSRENDSVRVNSGGI